MKTATNKRRIAVAAVALLCMGLVAVVDAPTSVATPAVGHVGPGGDSGAAVQHDTSSALRDIPPAAAQTKPSDEPVARDQFLPQHPSAGTPDQVAQRSVTRAAPVPLLNFNGVGAGFSGPSGAFSVHSAPPDTNSAVGPNHVVEIVNSSFAVFNKSGSPVYGPVQSNTLWSGFGGGCETNNDGDATVRYDTRADRWIVTQFSVSTTPYLECFAVSQTGDPTGAWNRYAFSFASFPDYPKVGVWPDAFYATYNLFGTDGTTFLGAEVCAMDRTSMLQGLPATQQCFTTSSSFGGLLPADLDGTTPPPAGAPNILLALGTTSTTLDYWKFHVDFSTPANSTFTGPTPLTVASYSSACGGGTCIPQAGTSQQLDSLADRLMFRLAYRNFGDHESLVTSNAVTAGSSVGVRWYELRLPGGTPTVFQQGTYAPDANFRWMSSAAMDQSGDIGLGFSLSGTNVHPAVHYAGRLASDPAGQMSQGEGSFVDGAGSQSGGRGLTRWGDYSSMSVDPSDGCSFWYSNEYLPTTGEFNWATRIGSFKFPSCGAAPANDFSLSASPASVTVAAGSSGSSTMSTAVTMGSGQTVTLSAAGLPTGATASFSPSSVTAGGSSTLTISTTPSTPAGTYPVTITGTGSSATHTASLSVIVTSVVSGGGVVNGGFETGNFTGWTPSGTESVSNSGPHSGTYTDQAGASSATNGDSSVTQTFTAPSGSTQLSFWYKMTCPDSVSYDWATATLKDNTTNTTATVLPRTCTTNGAYVQVTANVVAGHSYTLTMTSHDDNFPGDASSTKFDDVTLIGSVPSNDFSLAANPATVSVTAGGSGTSSISTAVTSGSAQTVNLSASGLPSGATATFSPTSVGAGGSSTLTLATGSSTPAGTYTVTVTGTGTSATHTTSVSLTVTAPVINDFSIGANPATVSVTAGGSGTSSISTAVTSGSAQTVNLSASGLPSGATATFSPTSVGAGGSSTLTLATGSSTPAGTYTVTVTGTGTSATHTTSVSLTVTAPVINDFSIADNPSSASVTAGARRRRR